MEVSLKITDTLDVGHLKKVWEDRCLRKKQQKASYNVNKTWFLYFTHLDLYTFFFFFLRQEQSYALKIKDKMHPLRIISQMTLGGKRACSY